MLCQACLEYDVHVRPDMDSAYKTLSGWPNVGQVCQLGLDVAHARMPQIEWREAITQLHDEYGVGETLSQAPQCPNAAGELKSDALWGSRLRTLMFRTGPGEAPRNWQRQMPVVQVCMEANNALRVLSLAPGPEVAVQLGASCRVGARFYECLKDPEHFRMWACATVNDIRGGTLGAPLAADFGRVVLKPSGFGDPTFSAMLRVSFPANCRRLSVQLHLWAEESPMGSGARADMESGLPQSQQGDEE